MNLDTLFQIANFSVMPFWLLMIFVPRRDWATRIIRSPLIALIPALIYVSVVVPLFARPGGFDFSAFGTLDGVISLLQTREGAMAGWSHFLAFDLLVGRWVYLDAIEKRIHPLLVAPTLFFVFMLGPLGFTLYLIVRFAYRAFRREPTPKQQHQ
jgi:hypothetical protein